MFRFASCTLLLCLVLPGHAVRRQDSSTNDCQATKYAGRVRHETRIYGSFGNCGNEVDNEKDCDSFYVENKKPFEGFRERFYQCHWLHKTTLGIEVKKCVVYSSLDKSLESCSPSKPEIQSLLKSREECHATLCDYARTGKWNGNSESKLAQGVQQKWPKKTMWPGSWGWAKTIEKMCDPQAQDGPYMWGNLETVLYWEGRKAYFNKASCDGCSSKDKC